MFLVQDLRIGHECWGSNVDPSIKGHLHYPNDLDRSLNETVVDKIRAYREDYNNRPSNDISFMSPIASTSGSLHSEFVSLLFLQSHRETDLFFESSGVQLPESTGVQFHYHRPSFSSHLKSKIVNILTNSIFRCSSPPRNPVYVRRVDPSALSFSLSSHRHSYDMFNNKQQHQDWFLFRSLCDHMTNWSINFSFLTQNFLKQDTWKPSVVTCLTRCRRVTRENPPSNLRVV